jgi:hypothetical protein
MASRYNKRKLQLLNFVLHNQSSIDDLKATESKSWNMEIDVEQKRYNNI